MVAPCPKKLSELNALIWGGADLNEDIFQRWCQGFYFSPTEPTALMQNGGGPCAVLAPVQAVILRNMLLSGRFSTAASVEGVDSSELLISAILDIMTLVKPNTEKQWTWVHWSNQNGEVCTVESALTPSLFFEGLRSISASSLDELHGLIMSLAPELQSPFAVLCFLYSILFTHGLSALRKGMADETDTLIDPVHGHASQCLINLLICGQTTPYLFDGERTISGITLTGIRRQPPTGFLTLFEALHYCESGWYLKNPSYPVWILGSETHFTVLASPELQLVSKEEMPSSGTATIRQAEMEFAKLSADQDTKSGFITSAQLGKLLEALNIPFTEESIADIQRKLDPEELGVILEEPFLRHFFPMEMSNRTSAVSNFQVIHYNGLVKSNAGGQVRYEFGEAHLLDPTEELIETDPVDQNPIHRCLRTKWPTIRIRWRGNKVPSLN
ncbi:hypothetical protein T265_15143 [Opisthorchis viverrini]|uniref:Ubiquitin carboxyl-terminal hydrolase MINDY n=1 Tax=Opisthorchis viverrini TaxID=6198 RepID=A0A075A1J3_OPIVI|nr:hypothetical protein T265_15143 [Opisthorchis viverrini]KER21259.1 hypothetical protein T265_15143 [Opisthorchis viverrini]